MKNEVWWNEAFGASVAMDGWIGAIIAAVVSALVALAVMLVSLWHNGNMARSQKRIDSFAEVAAFLVPLQFIAKSKEEFSKNEEDLRGAISRWSMYLEPGDEEFESAFRWGCAVAFRASRKSFLMFAGPRDPINDEELARMANPMVVEYVTPLVGLGKRWHVDKSERKKVIEELRTRFPITGQAYPREF